MSKFYLPTQKGVELFPNVIIAPPIIRWVGVDARTAEAQAILDTFGSAITAFYMQQAHNHSLSLNTQSRAFQQIAPNLGVEYVNQGGMEYITIRVQLAQPQPVVEQEVEKPVKPSTCWYPPEVYGEGSLYDMLVRSGVSLADPEPVHLEADPYYIPKGEYFMRIVGTIPLGFSRPLNLYGILFTEFGGTASWPYIMLNMALNPDFTNPGYPKDITLGGYAGSRSPAVLMMRSGSTVLPGGVDPRRYMMLEWIPTSTTEPGVSRSEMLFIEGHDRPDRGYCPTLFAYSSIGAAPIVGHSAVFSDTNVESPHSRNAYQTLPGSTANSFAWSYVDPATNRFVSLAADYQWAYGEY
ncbi:hypothetical protein UFOVP121_34 [uncultured Caudovirales phage]|uniref:Uncharacterized protein n=1 Tax=uncultured Caudovirales phage TaxID=2100421 RepID=A0A6J5LCY6_9CAUD|nr:hypothetical protein UFOVP121_34 [uncultured Caudovirales phage]CAB4134953.1 hypothetical protein UFOVP277_39 [uncultured Caudovirales phage]